MLNEKATKGGKMAHSSDAENLEWTLDLSAMQEEIVALIRVKLLVAHHLEYVGRHLERIADVLEERNK